MLWNNPSVHCEYVLFSLVNKEADWPIARQDQVRQDNQTENAEWKKGRVREMPAGHQATTALHGENEVTRHEPHGKA